LYYEYSTSCNNRYWKRSVSFNQRSLLHRAHDLTCKEVARIASIAACTLWCTSGVFRSPRASSKDRELEISKRSDPNPTSIKTKTQTSVTTKLPSPPTQRPSTIVSIRRQINRQLIMKFLHVPTLLLLSVSSLSRAFQLTSPFFSTATTLQRRLRRQEDDASSALYAAPEGFVDSALTVAAAAQALKGKIVVVKYGGNAMTSEDLKEKFCEDVAALQKLGIRVVVVHGGGPQINSMLQKVGVESRFEGGMRVSSTAVVEVAEMVLCGSVNKEISSRICSKGGRAIGLSGRDDSLLQCTKEINKDGFDLGYVGNVETVNTDLLNQLLDLGICPVVSPIGTGIGDEKDIAYNVNAEYVYRTFLSLLRYAVPRFDVIE
jgi:acetylglutamate kinase